MLTKEISEVEKELEKEFKMLNEGYGSHEARYMNIDLLRAKLSTLKSAQAKFNRFVEEELEFLKSLPTQSGKSSKYQRDRVLKRIDELSSKQEKKHCENCGCELETEFEIKEGWCDNCNLPERSSIK
jgi:hypothetical protein